MSKIPSETISILYLTEPQRLMIYRLWAEFKKPQRVIDEVKKLYNISLSSSVITDLCRDASAMVYINRFRDEYLLQVKSVPIANKKVRLEELQKNLDEANEMRDFLSTDAVEDRKELSMIQRRVNETVCVAREEVEGKPLIMQQFNVSQYSGMTDVELNNRIEKLILEAHEVKDIDGKATEG